MTRKVFPPVFENAPDVLRGAASRLPSSFIEPDKKVAHWVGPEI